MGFQCQTARREDKRGGEEMLRVPLATAWPPLAAREGFEVLSGALHYCRSPVGAKFSGIMSLATAAGGSGGGASAQASAGRGEEFIPISNRRQLSTVEKANCEIKS